MTTARRPPAREHGARVTRQRALIHLERAIAEVDGFSALSRRLAGADVTSIGSIAATWRLARRLGLPATDGWALVLAHRLWKAIRRETDRATAQSAATSRRVAIAKTVGALSEPIEQAAKVEARSAGVRRPRRRDDAPRDARWFVSYQHRGLSFGQIAKGHTEAIETEGVRQAVRRFASAIGAKLKTAGRSGRPRKAYN